MNKQQVIENLKNGYTISHNDVTGTTQIVLYSGDFQTGYFLDGKHIQERTFLKMHEDGLLVKVGESTIESYYGLKPTKSEIEKLEEKISELRVSWQAERDRYLSVAYDKSRKYEAASLHKGMVDLDRRLTNAEAELYDRIHHPENWK